VGDQVVIVLVASLPETDGDALFHA
jgi:hypothetical protein